MEARERNAEEMIEKEKSESVMESRLCVAAMQIVPDEEAKERIIAEAKGKRHGTTFIDHDVVEGTTYYYKVRTIWMAGEKKYYSGYSDVCQCSFSFTKHS